MNFLKLFKKKWFMINQFDKNTLLGCFFLFQHLYKVFVQFLGTSYFLLTVYYACTIGTGFTSMTKLPVVSWANNQWF